MKWFEGFGVLDSMGAKFLVAPFGDSSVAQVRVAELDKVQVVAGKSGHRFVAIVAVDSHGDYKKFEFTFDPDHRTYKLWTGPTDTPELNIAILPKGVCATIVDDGELSIFVPTNGKVDKKHDKHISTDMLVSNIGDSVAYIQNGEVWSMRTR